MQTVPDLDSKFYVATQTIDEARHVEVYSCYLHDKIGVVYPPNQNLRSLLDDVVSDSRWDLTYRGCRCSSRVWRWPPSASSASRRPTPWPGPSTPRSCRTKPAT